MFQPHGSAGAPFRLKTQTGEIFEYDFRGLPIPDPFLGEKQRTIIALQFQEKALYLIQPEDVTVCTNVPVQPPGFPLRPLKESDRPEMSGGL